MNSHLRELQPYPFERLSALLADVAAPNGLAPISMSIGEPRHAAPAFVLRELQRNFAGYSNYPKTAGIPELRDSITAWLRRRYALPASALDAARHVLPVNGSREALFAFIQCAVDATRTGALVAMPNPFYQIYEGGTLLAGATPLFLPELAERPGIPDLARIDDDTWRRCQLLIVCSPGNPSGAVLTQRDWNELFVLADRHDLIIAADECYAELYREESAPPVGVLQACLAAGRADFRRCIAFHSLSKRSSLPGMRSGFVAGDAEIIDRFLLYRTYHGCAMPLPHQHASALAWSDEAHVRCNRQLYDAKYDAVLAELDGCLDTQRPAGGFYLWPRTPVNELEFTRELFRQTHVTVLPGTFLSRPTAAGDPGAHRVRIALVAELAQCAEAARRIRAFMINR
jgi:N-succinyldiaminopimelate aminotransferase